MRKRVKGFAASPVVIVLVSVAIGAVAGAAGMWLYMSSHQGGLGDNDEMGISQETSVSEAVETLDIETMHLTVESTEAPSTEAITENLSYVKIIVSGSDYIYKDEPYTLDAVLAIVRTNADLEVRVVNDGASKHAYDKLIGALDQLHDELNVEYHTSKQ